MMSTNKRRLAELERRQAQGEDVITEIEVEVIGPDFEPQGRQSYPVQPPLKKQERRR